MQDTPQVTPERVANAYDALASGERERIRYLRWRDGKIIEGRGAIFGDGTAQYDAFWA